MFPTSPMPPRSFPIEHISTSQFVPPQHYTQPSYQPYPQPYQQNYSPYRPGPQPQYIPRQEPIQYSPSRSNYLRSDIPMPLSHNKDRYSYKPEILPIPTSFPDPIVSDEKNIYGQQREDVSLILYFFREILTFNVELERCKEDLMSKVGFSLTEFYKVFDDNQSGQVSYFELQKTFKKFFDIQISSDDIKQLILRFSRDKNLLLNYQEFSQIFTPKKRINPKKPRYDFIQKISTENSKTSMKLDYYLQVLIERIIKITITAENSYKFIKNKMLDKEINLDELFSYMNGNKQGTISAEDLQIMFEVYNFEASEEEIDTIIGFFDLNGNGRIGKSEFLDEFIIREV